MELRQGIAKIADLTFPAPAPAGLVTTFTLPYNNLIYNTNYSIVYAANPPNTITDA